MTMPYEPILDADEPAIIHCWPQFSPVWACPGGRLVWRDDGIDLDRYFPITDEMLFRGAIQALGGTPDTSAALPTDAALPWETACTVCGTAIRGPVLPPRVTLVDRPHRPHRFHSCIDFGPWGVFGRPSFREEFCGAMAGHWCLYPDLPYRTDTFEDLQEYWVGDTAFSPRPTPREALPQAPRTGPRARVRGA